jgi:molybdopterin molybdotransferase
MTLSAIQSQFSCADDYDPNSLPVVEALNRIDDVVKPIVGYEKVPLRSALHRVLAQTVISPFDVPGHDNSAMDGYAVRGADIPASGVTELRLVGTVLAGAPFAQRVESGQAVRIMTGGVMPEGTDTVVMQERAERNGDFVRIGDDNKVGQNTRRAGEDLKRGDAVLATGRLLQPADLGLIASLGIAEVVVRRRLRAAFFSTGDELCSIGEPLQPGQIYDSNRYTLHGMLTRLGIELIDMGVVRDDRDSLHTALSEAAGIADAVITSGGVSVGEADFVKDILTALGEVNFWKIAMKPGRPLAFGKINDAVFFGLPGNPVSVMVTFYQFVQPALQRMMGQQQTGSIVIKARSTGRLKKRAGRMEFQRGILERHDNGEMVVHGTGDQGSGILSTMSRANCFIILPEDCADVEAGSVVDVQPFDGLM